VQVNLTASTGCILQRVPHLSSSRATARWCVCRMSPTSRSAPKTTNPRSVSTQAGGLHRRAGRSRRQSSGVVRGVHKIWPDIQAQLPRGLNGEIVYDSTEFVNAAIYEVVLSLVEALVIVTLVVFCSLARCVRRSSRRRHPLSLVGTLIILLALGYSINLLTLLALVSPSVWSSTTPSSWWKTSAAISRKRGSRSRRGCRARELGGPIIAMTWCSARFTCRSASKRPHRRAVCGIRLRAGWRRDRIGRGRADAIAMLCSRLLKVPDPNHRGWEEKFTYYVDRGFVWLRAAYERRLHGSLIICRSPSSSPSSC